MKSADVVIIGGGVQGLSNGYFLAKRGLKVIVVERGDLASGTSCRNDGDNFECDAAPGFITEFTNAAVNLVKDVAKSLDYDVDWLEKGMVVLPESEEEMQIARQIYQEKRAAGIDVRLMDKYEVHEDEPNTAPDIPGGLEYGNGGSLNSMLFAFALGEHIKKMGGELLRFTTVTGFGFDETGAVCKVETDKGDILTQKVVLAAGVWSGKIAELANLYVPITPMKGDLLVVEPGAYITRRKTEELGYALVRNESDTQRAVTPFMKAHGIGFLIEPTGSHNALIGFSKYPCDTTTSNNLVMRAIAKRAMRFFPCIANVNIIHAYAGLRPWTPDHEAIVSDTPIPGFYVCAGHAGNGITNGPISAKLLGQIMFHEKTDFDMSRLSLSRFTKPTV